MIILAKTGAALSQLGPRCAVAATLGISHSLGRCSTPCAVSLPNGNSATPLPTLHEVL